jgi:general secretion pathway protein C
MNNPVNLFARIDADTRVTAAYRWVADGERLPKIQRMLLVVLVLWGLNSAVNLIWSLFPSAPIDIPATEVINPPPGLTNRSAGADIVDVSSILGLNVFGAVVSDDLADEVIEEPTASSREGIEDGAKETRLALTLTGIVSSTTDGLGMAMIESRKEQALYAVGDELPANGKVMLAKILPKQVVIDNNGTYELITLFDDNGIVGIVQTNVPAVEDKVSSGADAELTMKAAAQERSRLAANYRQQLYKDPQSLTGLVSITAVQGEQGIKGYRLSPGKDVAKFTALGFETGDIVTGVNGYSLSDPSNTMRLYQLMRDAAEATIEIDRNGSPVSLNLSLGTIQ